MKLVKLFPVALIMFFVISCASSSTQERSQILSEKSVTWLGVDYSLAKFSFINDTPQEIKGAMLAINNFVVNEQKKYNIRKYFKKVAVEYDISMINKNNEKIDPEKLVISNVYSITQDDVKKLVSSYDTKGKKGMGLVFVAENMNKAAGVGSFYVCFFDLGTKQIIESVRLEGKSGGFGLNAFWARSVWEVMKKWN